MKYFSCNLSNNPQNDHDNMVISLGIDTIKTKTVNTFKTETVKLVLVVKCCSVDVVVEGHLQL